MYYVGMLSLDGRQLIIIANPAPPIDRPEHLQTHARLPHISYHFMDVNAQYIRLEAALRNDRSSIPLDRRHPAPCNRNRSIH